MFIRIVGWCRCGWECQWVAVPSGIVQAWACVLLPTTLAVAYPCSCYALSIPVSVLPILSMPAHHYSCILLHNYHYYYYHYYYYYVYYDVCWWMQMPSYTLASTRCTTICTIHVYVYVLAYCACCAIALPLYLPYCCHSHAVCTWPITNTLLSYIVWTPYSHYYIMIGWASHSYLLPS